MQDRDCERVKVRDAARELGMSQNGVRMHMRKHLMDLGKVYSPTETGKKQWEYHIYRSKLDKQLGKGGDPNA